MRFDPRSILCSSAIVVLATGASVCSARTELDAAVDDAVLRLEQLTDDPMLLPAPPAYVEEEVAERHRMAIARSILTLEAHVDTTLAVLEGDVLTLLSLARNHRHLGLRRQAQLLYEQALLADRDHRYGEELLSERVQCAIELADSAAVDRGTREILGRDDAADFGPVLGSALEFFVAAPTLGRAVEDLVDRTAAVAGLRDAQTWLQIARARQMQGRHGEARAVFASLVSRQRDLTPHQACIALMGLADASLAAGAAPEALSLYRTYRDHDLGRLSAWATYQLGNLAAASGNLDDAIAMLRSICEREDPTPWRDQACRRLAQVRELEEIDAALRPYGRTLSASKESR